MFSGLFGGNKTRCKACGRKIGKSQVFCEFCGAKQVDTDETLKRGTEQVIRSLLDNYQAILKNHLPEANVRFQLGIIFKLRGMLDEAMREFRAASTIDQSNADYYMAMASVESARRHFSEAVEYYRKAIAIHPGYADLHNNLGVAYYKKDEIDSAIDEFRKAIEINPGYANAHNNLGMAYRKKGRKDLADEEFRRAQNMDGEKVMADYELGKFYYSGGMFDESAAAKEVDPKVLGDLFFTARMYEEALAQYEIEAKKHSGFADVHNRLGMVYGQLGRTEEAREEFSKAIRINPSYKEAKANLERLEHEKK